MDILLLSKMVKELILDNDRVTLPGLGAFVAEIVPSSFSDRGYTINPPYRKISFRTGADSDMLLAEFYAANNGVAKDVSLQILSGFTAELGKALETSRVVQLPGLGRLRAGRDGNIFFIPDEDLDIYPAGFGLEPISLKTHSKPTSFDFSTLDVPAGPAPAVDVLAEAGFSEPAPAAEEPAADGEVPVSVADEPAMEEVADSADVTEAVAETVVEESHVAEAEPEIETEVEVEAEAVAERRRLSGFAVAAIVAAVIVVAVIAAFYVMVYFFPDALDKLLYTKEELEILNYYK